MSEARTEVKLGEVFATTSERIGSRESEPRVFSISKHDGVVPADEYHGRRIASDRLDAYKSLPRNGWAYSTIHIDEGSIARNHHDYEGAVSPMYTTFRWTSDVHDPDFFELLLRSPEMLGRYKDSAQGSINRRRSLPWSTFSTMSVFVPPLPEQRHIVDLIGALDEAIEAAAQSSSALSTLQKELLSSRFATETTCPVADFAELLVGYAFKSSDYAPDGIRLIRGDNIVPGGIRWEDAKFIAEEAAADQSDRYSLSVNDIVLAMDRPVISSGVKVGLIKPDDLPALLVQRVARLRPSTPDHGRSIELCFGSREFQAYLLSGQVGSHVPHINGKQITEFHVPVSMFQPGGSELIAAANDAAVASSDYADSLRAVRTELLAALLSGEHEIPSSYDEELGVVE